MTDKQTLIPTDPITGAKYFVFRKYTLVHSTEIEGRYAVMAGDPLNGGYDWKNGPVCADPQDLRPATVADFNSFRVSIEGYLG